MSTDTDGKWTRGGQLLAGRYAKLAKLKPSRELYKKGSHYFEKKYANPLKTIYSAYTFRIYYQTSYDIYALTERAACLWELGLYALAIGDLYRFIWLVQILYGKRAQPEWLAQDAIIKGIEKNKEIPLPNVKKELAIAQEMELIEALRFFWSPEMNKNIENIGTALEAVMYTLTYFFARFATPFGRLLDVFNDLSSFFPKEFIEGFVNQAESIYDAHEQEYQDRFTSQMSLHQSLGPHVLCSLEWKRFFGNRCEMPRTIDTLESLNYHFQDKQPECAVELRPWRRSPPDVSEENSPQFAFYARRKIAKGDLISIDRTALIVQNTNYPETPDFPYRCSACFKPVTTYGRRGIDGVICCYHNTLKDGTLSAPTVYCNRQCQYADREPHKLLHNKQIPSAYRYAEEGGDYFPLFLVLVACHAHAIKPDFNPLNLGPLRAILEVFGRDTTPLDLELTTHYAAAYEALLELGVDIWQNRSYDTWTLLTLRHKFDEYSFVMWGMYYLFPMRAWYNHSCDYNAIMITSSKEPRMPDEMSLPFYARRDIEEGEEVTISYIGRTDTLDHKARADKLKLLGILECTCARCELDNPPSEPREKTPLLPSEKPTERPKRTHPFVNSLVFPVEYSASSPFDREVTLVRSPEGKVLKAMTDADFQAMNRALDKMWKHYEKRQDALRAQREEVVKDLDDEEALAFETFEDAIIQMYEKARWRPPEEEERILANIRTVWREEWEEKMDPQVVDYLGSLRKLEEKQVRYVRRLWSRKYVEAE